MGAKCHKLQFAEKRQIAKGKRVKAASGSRQRLAFRPGFAALRLCVNFLLAAGFKALTPFLYACYKLAVLT